MKSLRLCKPTTVRNAPFCVSELLLFAGDQSLVACKPAHNSLYRTIYKSRTI
jgi:hypothetical protein